MLPGPSPRFHFAALGLVLLTLAIRLPALLHPLPIDDEAVYSVVANEMVDGGRPYIDAVERKPPLLFWTYAAVFEVAGKLNWKALHAVALGWTLATMAGLYVIGKGLFNRQTGLVAALLYSVFQPWGTWKNLGFNGELLMNLPIVWAWAIGFRRSSSRIRPELLGAGALLCAAFLLKQPAAIAAVPLAIYLLLPSYRAERDLRPAISVLHALILTAGFFGTLTLATVILWKQSILREAFYWVFTNHADPKIFFGKALVITAAFVAACLPLMIGLVMAIRNDRRLWAGQEAERTGLLALVVASAIGAAAGGRFYPHYYIQLLPALALLAAPHYAYWWAAPRQPRPWLLRRPVVSAWLAGIVITFSVAHWWGLSSRREPSAAAEYLQKHSAPDARVFVWGESAAKTYLEAARRPACRYVLTFPLTGHVFGGPNGIDTHKRILPTAWSTLEQDFTNHPPAYIVDDEVNPGAAYPARNFPVLTKLLSERYRPVARSAEAVVYQIR